MAADQTDAGRAATSSPSGSVFGRTRPDLRTRSHDAVAGRVSVIIPCFNSESFIGDAIASALDQVWPDLEVIVVDDGSTDNSWNAILGFGDRVIAHRIAHGGASAARNHGLMMATGEFIQFLDADDELVASSIRARMGTLADDADIDAVFGDLEFVEHPSGRSVRITSHADWPHPRPLPHVIRNNINTECPLHRRRLLYRIGGFDESLPCSQERDLHLRLVLAGARFEHLPMLVARARIHSGSTRIENRPWWIENPELHIAILDFHLNLIHSADRNLADSDVMEALALKLWSRGMIAGRNGAYPVARRYFDQAKQRCPSFDPPVKGWFRTAYKMFGPSSAVILLHLKNRLGQLVSQHAR